MARGEREEGNGHKQGLTRISVTGYKSLADECAIDVRPLTMLAGANSSGKSSIVQPLLLLKQTLEASFDPGPLLINGPNARFNSTKELLSKVFGQSDRDSFADLLETNREASTRLTFKKDEQGFALDEMTFREGDIEAVCKPGMSTGEIETQVMKVIPADLKQKIRLSSPENPAGNWTVNRRRCFLEIESVSKDFPLVVAPASAFPKCILGLIHVPGLRGNPERTYKASAVGARFPGTFENYVASIVNQWQVKRDKRIDALGAALEALGLTWKVDAQRVNDTQVELLVGRLPHSRGNGAEDLVNIADVGFGVSQALPVVVALLTAKPQQLVYLEQPEIHLHPNGQVALATLLTDAAQRGVRVIAETHSSLLLLAVQTLVARGEVPTDLVKLHWFERNGNGKTTVTSADLDRTGAFGDWPEDFDNVILQAQSRYLDAAEVALQDRAG